MDFDGYYPGKEEFSLKLYDQWTQQGKCEISSVAKQQFEVMRYMLDHSILRKHEILYGMQKTLGEMTLDYTADAHLPHSYDDGSNWRYMHHGFNKMFLPPA